MFVSGQKNILSNIEFFDVSSEIEELPKIFEFRENLGQKNSLVNIADSEINFLCEAVLR